MKGTAQGRAGHGFVHAVYEFWVDHWAAAFFSAAVAVLLHDTTALQTLSKLSLVAVSNIAAAHSALEPLSPPGAGPSVTAITVPADVFETRYRGQSPLNRCLLADDIATIVAPAGGTPPPLVLAVDFDLSPDHHAGGEAPKIDPPSPDSTRDDVFSPALAYACQRKLDRLLDARAGQLVVLSPFPVTSVEAKATTHGWMRARCAAGVRFADGFIENSFGVVTEMHPLHGLTQPAGFADQMIDARLNSICEAITRVEDPRENMWLDTERVAVLDRRTPEDHETNAPRVIDFPAVLHGLREVPFGDWRPLADPAPHYLFLGGDWGEDDTYLTPIGDRIGVSLHAAQLLTRLTPEPFHLPHRNLLSDLAMALAFAFAIDRFWHAYVRARRLDLLFERKSFKTGLSTFVVITFICFYAAMVIVLFYAAVGLLLQHVRIEPLFIAVSMLIDGFIAGPVETIRKLLAQEPRPSLDPSENTIRSAALMTERRAAMQFLAVWLVIGLVTILVYRWPNLLLEGAGAFFNWVVLAAVMLFAGACLVSWIADGRALRKKLAARVKALLPFGRSAPVEISRSWRGLAWAGRMLAWLRAGGFLLVVFAGTWMEFFEPSVHLLRRLGGAH